MLPCSAALLPIDSHFDGHGATLYVSPPNGSREEIVFDRFRPLGRRLLVIDEELDAEAYLRSDAGVARVEYPATSINWTVPADYYGCSCWIQVRPFEGGLELDTLAAAQRVEIAVDGSVVFPIAGRVLILRRQLLANAGVLLEWQWFRDLAAGVDPTSFEWRAETDGSGDVPDDLIVTFEAGSDYYTATMTGFSDGETYRLKLFGVRGESELLLATVEFVADGSGPAVTLVGTVEEET